MLQQKAAGRIRQICLDADERLAVDVALAVKVDHRGPEPRRLRAQLDRKRCDAQIEHVCGRCGAVVADIILIRQEAVDKVLADLGQGDERALALRAVQKSLLHQIVNGLPDGRPADTEMLDQFFFRWNEAAGRIGPGLDLITQKLLQLEIQRNGDLLVQMLILQHAASCTRVCRCSAHDTNLPGNGQYVMTLLH